MEISSQGLRLKILLKQKNISIKEAAPALGYSASQSLSRVFRENVLPADLIERAAELLGVPQSDITGDVAGEGVREDTPAYVADRSASKESEIERLRAEVEALREQLEREKKISSELSEAILNLTKPK